METHEFFDKQEKFKEIVDLLRLSCLLEKHNFSIEFSKIKQLKEIEKTHLKTTRNSLVIILKNMESVIKILHKIFYIDVFSSKCENYYLNKLENKLEFIERLEYSIFKKMAKMETKVYNIILSEFFTNCTISKLKFKQITLENLKNFSKFKIFKKNLMIFQHSSFHRKIDCLEIFLNLLTPGKNLKDIYIHELECRNISKIIQIQSFKINLNHLYEVSMDKFQDFISLNERLV